jgi:hypothetical protein
MFQPSRFSLVEMEVWTGVFYHKVALQIPAMGFLTWETIDGFI